MIEEVGRLRATRLAVCMLGATFKPRLTVPPLLQQCIFISDVNEASKYGPTPNCNPVTLIPSNRAAMIQCGASGASRASNRLDDMKSVGGCGSGVRVPNRKFIVFAAFFAAAVKLYCAATTFGSGDVMIISRFGQLLDLRGFEFLYRGTRLFNHPPVTGAFFALLYEFAAKISSLGDHNVPSALPFLLRLPSAIADFAAVIILLKLYEKHGKPRFWGLMVFALSPAAFMTSGFHGNVDAIMVCAVLLAAYYCVEDDDLLSGVALGFACSIRIVPFDCGARLILFLA